ncbi:MAG: mandelate racemase/muconate lactonizing enzyme family protein [Armatimonadetes bacterium]|nr:mandelate racemase/muconate lactonizing enzyme family protein [Armatimonadota bacterium]
MRITSVEPFPVSTDHSSYLFVRVQTDAGRAGIGEAGLTSQELVVAEAVNYLAPLLIGQDATRIGHLWQVMFRSAFFPADRVMCAAISAIDIALWDLRGQALGVPVYDLLGGRVRDRVVCYPHVQGRTMEETVANARRHVDEGWKFVRFDLEPRGEVLEPPLAVQDAIPYFAAIREAVGPEIGMCLDIHTRLDTADTIALCRALEPYRPYFLEDPLRSENPGSFRTLARHVSTPLAAGEQFATKWAFRELIEEELIRYARVDLCVVGGITEARKIAGWCETHYIQMAPHSPVGPVSTAACLHLDLATPNFGVQELAHVPGTMLADLFPVQVSFEAGHLLPPTRPGLGVVFDAAAAAAHPYQPGHLPRLRRADGSFTNW